MKSNDKGQNDKEKWTFNESVHLKKNFKKGPNWEIFKF